MNTGNQDASPHLDPALFGMIPTTTKQSRRLYLEVANLLPMAVDEGPAILSHHCFILLLDLLLLLFAHLLLGLGALLEVLVDLHEITLAQVSDCCSFFCCHFLQEDNVEQAPCYSGQAIILFLSTL